MAPLWEHYKLVIPANFFLISFVHEQVDVPDQLICTMGLGVNAGTSTPANFDDLADAWEANIVTPILSVDQTFVRMNVADSGGVVLSVDRADVGGYAPAIAPPNNAIIVEKRTGLSGRENRGRMYLPAVAEGEVSNAGRLDPTHRSGVDLDFANFQTALEAIDAGEWFPYILHTKKWNGGVEPADPGNAPAPTQITSWYTRPIIGTQRRRLR